MAKLVKYRIIFEDACLRTVRITRYYGTGQTLLQYLDDDGNPIWGMSRRQSIGLYPRYIQMLVYHHEAFLRGWE